MSEYVWISHKLDPADLAWPGEPVLKVNQATTIGVNGSVYNSVVMTVPNHFGTHYDAPKHFNPKGLALHELPIEYFAFDGPDVLLLDIPKKPEECVMKEDVEKYKDQVAKAKLLLIRTGAEDWKFKDPKTYQNKGPCIHPGLSRYLVETFPHLNTIGMDFLSIGSPCNDLSADAHQWLLGCHTEKFITGIEDMHLAALGKGRKIDFVTIGAMRVVGADSAQVSCIAKLD
jgi:kynurenine formamidase